MKENIAKAYELLEELGALIVECTERGVEEEEDEGFHDYYGSWEDAEEQLSWFVAQLEAVAREIRRLIGVERGAPRGAQGD